MASCAQKQILSPAKHFLLSAYGTKWKKANLVMFTVYVDDSGTADDQKTVVAAALIVPARKSRRWNMNGQIFAKSTDLP